MSVRVRQPWHCFAIVASALLASSCGGEGGSNSPTGQASSPVVQRPTSLTDLEIAQLVYTGSPRTPDGFYAETALASYAYVNTSHLKNTDVGDVPSGSAQYELCSDDWNEALGWSELAQQRAGEYADLMATDETPHYFEFGRMRSSEPDRYLRSRVFKCAYLQRDTNNLRTQSGSAGLLKNSPIDAESLKSISEYLWQFTSYNNYGHVVLSSTGETLTTALRRTLLIANREANGTSSTCDRIYIETWRHEAATATGELTRSVEEQWSFGAREVDGVVELCN